MNTNRHDGCYRGFYWFSQAYYAKSLVRNEGKDFIDEIMIGMYHLEGGTTGEFAIRWSELGGRPVPRLEVYGDAWSALPLFKDLLEWLSSQPCDKPYPTPKQLSDALLSIGVVDRTMREPK